MITLLKRFILFILFSPLRLTGVFFYVLASIIEGLKPFLRVGLFLYFFYYMIGSDWSFLDSRECGLGGLIILAAILGPKLFYWIRSSIEHVYYVVCGCFAC